MGFFARAASAASRSETGAWRIAPWTCGRGFGCLEDEDSGGAGFGEYRYVRTSWQPVLWPIRTTGDGVEVEEGRRWVRM